MAEFPTVYKVQRDGFQCEMDDGMDIKRAEDGTPRIRRLYSTNWYNIRFRIAPLTAANRQAVDQFHTSYRNEYIDWTNPFTGDVFKILLTNPPRVVRYEAPNLCIVEISAIGYINNA